MRKWLFKSRPWVSNFSTYGKRPRLPSSAPPSGCLSQVRAQPFFLLRLMYLFLELTSASQSKTVCSDNLLLDLSLFISLKSSVLIVAHWLNLNKYCSDLHITQSIDWERQQQTSQGAHRLTSPQWGFIFHPHLLAKQMPKQKETLSTKAHTCLNCKFVSWNSLLEAIWFF